MQSLGEFLRYARKSKGITQEELASEMHVVSPVISKWENGKSIPDLVALCKLCNILNISLEECLACDKLEELLILPPNNYDAQKLGDRLRGLRLKNNLSQSDVGKDLFVTSQTVSRWESGGMTSLDNLQTICNFYGISPSRLMQEDFAQTVYSQVNSFTDEQNSTFNQKIINPKHNNINKRLIIALSILVVVILSAFLVTAILWNSNTDSTDADEDNHTHNLSYIEELDPTCEIDGNIEYWQCNDCKMCFSDEDGNDVIHNVFINKTGHQFSKWIEVSQATCSKNGIEDRVCLVCNTKESRLTDCLSHKLTYTSDKDTHSAKCELCEDILELEVSHIYENGICSSCGYIKLECIAPLDEYTFGKVFFMDPVFNPTGKYYHPHRAVDFNAPAGSQVKCIFDGVVKDITNDGYYGTNVYIEHIHGFVSVYKLLRNSYLQVGDKVSKGDVIGEVSDTVLDEIMDGPHLHLELYKGEEEVDPLDYMPGVNRPPDDYINNFNYEYL